MTSVLDQVELRRVFGAFPTGVTAVAALGEDGRPIGLAANSFTSVSLDPPLVSVSVAHTSTTWPVLRRRERLGVSVLGAHQEQAARQLSARSPDRFAGLAWRVCLDGAAQVLALEAVSARGWRAREVRTSADGWLLRADRGWTGRANSALALRTVRRPLDEVLADVTTWYATRGLPARIQVPEPAAAALGHALGRRGWTSADHTDVLVSRLVLLAGDVGAPGAAGDVTLAARPDDDWLAAYHYRGGARLPDGAGDLLARHDRVAFARVVRDGQVVAIGRGAVDDGWLGITAIDVASTHRRQGLAAAVVGRLGRWGATMGAVRAYAQSDRTNDPAHRLFEGLGFHLHHSYFYRSAPTIEVTHTAHDPHPHPRPT